MTPTVTVLLPVYNGAPFLAEALASVRRQGYQAWRLLVLDDGSTDDSVGVALEGCGSDPRCTVWRGGRRGLTATLRAGVEMAGTPWLARLDADDAMLPDRLARQLALGEAQGYTVLGSATLEQRVGWPASHRTQPYPLCDWQCRQALGRWRVRNPFAHSAVLLRRQAVLEAGNYDPRWARCQDLDLWLRMAARPGSKLGNLAEPLTLRRLHPGQRSAAVWRRRWDQYRLVLHAKRRRNLPARADWGGRLALGALLLCLAACASAPPYYACYGARDGAGDQMLLCGPVRTPPGH